MKNLIAALGLSVAFAVPALAHQLKVFAFVEGADVVIEAKFTSGRAAVAGEYLVLDAEGTELLRAPLSAEGDTRFAIPDGGKDGMTVEVITDAGHTDYWLLTPADLEASQ